MKDSFRRGFIIFMVVLFVVTSVGIGVVGFWQAVNSDNKDSSSKENKMDGLAGKPLANFTPIAKIDSLQKIDQNVGTGAEAKPESTVTVNYTGAIASSGIVFESSLDSGQPATLGLNQVIKGWTEGVPGMKVGGTRRLLIPAAMAYGDQGSATIPANSDLVFDITLIAVK